MSKSFSVNQTSTSTPLYSKLDSRPPSYSSFQSTTVSPFLLLKAKENNSRTSICVCCLISVSLLNHDSFVLPCCSKDICEACVKKVDTCPVCRFDFLFFFEVHFVFYKFILFFNI